MATQNPVPKKEKVKKEAAKKAPVVKFNLDGTPKKKKRKPYNLSAEAIAKRQTSGAPQYTKIATQKDRENTVKYYAILRVAPKKMEADNEGKLRKVIADTNMRIMAKQVIKNIRLLQKNAIEKQSPNKNASDNLQSFVTLYK